MTARLGGGEFAVVMHGVVGAGALSAFAARIVDTRGAPYHSDDRTLTVSACRNDAESGSSPIPASTAAATSS